MGEETTVCVIAHLRQDQCAWRSLGFYYSAFTHAFSSPLTPHRFQGSGTDSISRRAISALPGAVALLVDGRRR